MGSTWCVLEKLLEGKAKLNYSYRTGCTTRRPGNSSRCSDRSRTRFEQFSACCPPTFTFVRVQHALTDITGSLGYRLILDRRSLSLSSMETILFPNDFPRKRRSNAATKLSTDNPASKSEDFHVNVKLPLYYFVGFSHCYEGQWCPMPVYEPADVYYISTILMNVINLGLMNSFLKRVKIAPREKLNDDTRIKRIPVCSTSLSLTEKIIVMIEGS